MPAATDYLEKQLLDHILGVSTYPSPTAGSSRMYMAVGTSQPDESSSSWAGEISGKGYKRVVIPGFKRDTSAIYDTVRNKRAFRFPTATEEWGTLNYFAIYDAKTDGNMLLRGQSAGPTVLAGDWVTVKAGELSFFEQPSGEANVSKTSIGSQILAHVFLGATFSPGDVYMHLKPKPSDAAYAPINCAGSWSYDGQDQSNQGVSKNTSEFRWNTATEDWGSVQPQLKAGSEDDADLVYVFSGAGASISTGDQGVIGVGKMECKFG